MNVAEVTNACRLCPTGGANLQQLISIFDEKVSKNNMKDIILVTTGVEVMENDIITSKICPRCQNITQKIFQFRQDAQKQDRRLKAIFNNMVTEQVLPKVTNKETVPKPIQVKTEPETETETETLHPSVKDIYKKNPTLKVPRVCVGQHMAPVVSLDREPVERYIKKQKLDKLNNYVPITPATPNISQKVVSPLRISKKQTDNPTSDTYFCINRTPTTSRQITVNDSDEAVGSSTASSTPSSHETRSTTIPSPALGSVREEFFATQFGLIPTVTKTLNLLTCEHCGGLYNNSSDRKRHIQKVHAVCKFCRKKFRSVSANLAHQQNGCHVTEIMQNPGPIVALQRIELDLEIRKKFPETFEDFEPIPCLVDDDVIVLSDDDDERPAPVEPEPEVFKRPLEPPVSVSIVRPSVRVKNDKTLDDIEPGLDNVALKRRLRERLPQCRKFKDLEVQTDFLPDKILVNNDGTCQFDGLKNHLLNFIVPVKMHNGLFQASYKVDYEKTPRKPRVDYKTVWNTMQLVDVTREPGESAKTTPSLQHDARVVASQRIFTSTAVTNNLKTPSPVIVAASPTNPAVVNSATPLLQSYALSVEPASSANLPRPIPFPKKYIQKSIPRLIFPITTSAPSTSKPITIIGVYPPNKSNDSGGTSTATGTTTSTTTGTTISTATGTTTSTTTGTSTSTTTGTTTSTTTGTTTSTTTGTTTSTVTSITNTNTNTSLISFRVKSLSELQ